MTTPVFPDAPRDLAVELYVNDGWQDITPHVYQRDPIRISRGRPNETTTVAPSSCSLTLNNRGGTYSPRNPIGPYYGSIGRNTPLRVAIRTAKDSFTRTVASGWGTADVGGAWSTHGAGGSVLASQWNVAAGAGTITVSVADAQRLSYQPAQLYRDVDVAVTVSAPVADVTGAAIEFALALSGVSTTDYFRVVVKAQTTEAVTIAIFHYSGTTIVGDTTVAGLTFSSGTQLRIRGQVDGQTIRAKVWAASASEPYAWNVEGRSDLLSGRAAGWVGVRGGLYSGNTNAPVTFSFDSFEVRSTRFFGEVSNWPSQWDTSGNDVYAQIEAAGILRRLGQGQPSLRSTLYRGYTTVSPALLGYWPVEDGTDSTEIASGIGGAPMQLKGGTTTFATNSSFAGSAPIAKSNASQWSAVLPGAANTGKIQAVFLMQLPDAGETDLDAVFRIDSSGTAAFWDLTYGTLNNGSFQLNVYDQGRSLIHSSGFTFSNLNGQPMQVSIQLEQNGSDVDYVVAVMFYGATGGLLLTGTVTGRTVGSCLGVMANQYRQCTGTAYGHIAVRNYVVSIFALAAQLRAYVGETARARMARLCSETGVSFAEYNNGQGTASTLVGPQARDSFLALIGEAAAADMGSLSESRSALGLIYRLRNSLYNQRAALTLDYDAGHLAPPFRPVEDDQALRNDVTVTRKNGSSYQVEQQTGPLAVTEPSTGVGVGRYDTAVTLNLAYDQQAADAASWLVHLGTVDEARYPSIKVNVAKLAKVAPALALDALAVTCDDRIVIENPKATVLAPEDISQLVRGYTEEIRALEHDLTFQCTPASPYDVLVLDDDSLGKIDTDTSALVGAAGATDTQLLVSDYPGPGWTSDPAEMPIPIVVGGEEMSVTAISAAAPSFVGAGAAATGNNASVAPGDPAGLQVGDLKVVAAAIRNSGTGFPLAPTGWSQIGLFGNLAVFGKYHASGDTAPTVAFQGGVANADTIAQVCAFRGVSLRVFSDSQYQLNGSAQNIAYPSCATLGPNTVVLYVGWKADDWASVATVAGATEIGEPSSTAGDDAGLVWDYRIQTTPVSIPAGVFTVTGGASAISRGAVIVLDGNVQRMTVTRSVNGVVKPHASGATVSLARPAAIAL
ncbi:MAG TPA: hypothetical protein VFG15_06370 [Amycolatopsis sp.]|nr:hypothetical protein [Amycolatopsis sp.]